MLIKQKKSTTMQPWDPRPYTVTEVRQTRITGERGEKVRTRNIEKWKVVKKRPEELEWEAKKKPSLQAEDSDSEWDFNIKPSPGRMEGGNILNEDQDMEAPAQLELEEMAPRQDNHSPPAHRTRSRTAGPRSPQPGPSQPRTPQLSPQERRRRQAAAKKSSKRGSYEWIQTGGGRFIKQWVPEEEEEAD